MSLGLTRHLDQQLSPSGLAVNHSQDESIKGLAELEVVEIEHTNEVLIGEGELAQRGQQLFHVLQTLHEVGDAVRQSLKSCQLYRPMADLHQELVEVFANRFIDEALSTLQGLESKGDDCVEVIQADLRRKCLAAPDELALKGNDRLELFLLYLLAYLCPNCRLVILLDFVVEAFGLLPLAD